MYDLKYECVLRSNTSDNNVLLLLLVCFFVEKVFAAITHPMLDKQCNKIYFK